MGGDRLRRRREADLGAASIEDLPLKFAAVATEIGIGHEVWLKSGPLAFAVRASYALPGVFEPAKRSDPGGVTLRFGARKPRRVAPGSLRVRSR